MHRSLLPLLLISLPAPAYAQVLPGDLLLNSWAGPDLLIHYRPDGTVVQTSSGGTGKYWLGAAILPNGNWVTTRRQPTDGVNTFDGVTGAEIATWDLPPGVTATADVGVFSDGTLAVVEQAGKVWRLDIAGNVIASWNVSSHPFGILVDDQDHVWTCDVSSGVLWHTDDQGNKINEFTVGNTAGDVTMALDGTLFVIRSDSGEVAHYSQDGTLLGDFTGTGKPNTTGIAMGADQTLWITGFHETILRNFDQDGNLLGYFDVGPAGIPTFLTILPIGTIGTSYCVATPNSSGLSATMSAVGSEVIADNNVLLVTKGVAIVQVGYYLMSDAQAFVPAFGGSQGNLCLGPPIKRLSKDVDFSGTTGLITLQLDLTSLPQGTVFQPGETWNFQLWFRDVNPNFTSNTSDGLAITFR